MPRIPFKSKLTERKKVIKANDRLFREIIHIRDNERCQKTYKPDNLQVAHYWRRSILRTRWDEDNACLLNGGIHLYWAHSCFQDFTAFWLKRLGQKRFDDLEFRARYVAPVNTLDLRFINYQLNERLEELKNGGGR